MLLKSLTDWFDQVHVISCVNRPHRLEAFKENILRTKIADYSKIRINRAVMGEAVGFPRYWKAGSGAWGCLQSHKRVIEDVMCGHYNEFNYLPSWTKNYVVLEDDVQFTDDALVRLNRFMEKVPNDWGQIYFGGQHFQEFPYEPTEDPEIFVGRSINRLHAYAVHERIYLKFYSHICNAPDYGRVNHHIDHQLEAAHRRRDWKVYCPPRWFAGQRAGWSDINWMKHGDRMWQPTAP
jgi:GR25 family glycosyltransferase involved in LPS biosynthesis